MNLPNDDIKVVHRSDGSGTTFVWTDYLSKVSPEWKSKVGANTSVNWPVGLGGKGNEGVAGLVKQTPGSIGYVELIYAVQTKMAYGTVKNAAGSFVKADFNTVTEAAAARPRTCRPISAFPSPTLPARTPTRSPASPGCWSRQDRQCAKEGRHHRIPEVDADRRPEKCAAPMSYAPLPKPVVAKEEKQIAMVK